MGFTRSVFYFCTAATVWSVVAFRPLPTDAAQAEVIQRIDERFAAADVDEVPGFQRHVVNLFGRLGCNGRSCHGSFQGRGGFQLSLFGYDFQTDHDALFDKDSPRIDLEDPDESLIIAMPTDENMHSGGKRYDADSWQHHVLRRWIESGAMLKSEPDLLVGLELTPSEIRFRKGGEQVQLRAVAVWEDGSREDVSPLCRFSSNDEQVAKIDENGLVTSAESGDTHVVVSYDIGVTTVPVLQPVSQLAGDRYPDVSTPTQVDELVVAKLRKLGIVPSDQCTDAEFLRRIRLDMTGSLPAPSEVEEFLADKASDKRTRKIDELLKTPAYAAWWTTKLCDFTGNNEDQLTNATPMRGQASKDWYQWIYQRVTDNTPYDELAEGIVTAVSRRPGQSYMEYCQEMSELCRSDTSASFADLPSMTHYWARRDLRDPDARVISFAYSFMGIRIQCAQCHKHPFDQWSKDDFHQFKNFFTSVVASTRATSPEARKEYDQIVRQLGVKGKSNNELRREFPKLLKQGKTIPFPELTASRRPAGRAANRNSPTAGTAKLLGGDVVDLAEYKDPRTVLMDWLRDKDNRFFARAFVNRVWASYFNVGIVNPPDDLSLANPPSNGPLLDYLAQGFIESGFDMKWVHREITGSRTYQASWQSNETNRDDVRNFSHAIPRRLPAEVLYDAVQQATASDVRIAEMQRDLDSRAISIPGSGVRNQRAGAAAYALTVFGRSTRDSNCDCDRSEEASLLQTVYLQNDREILQLVGVRKGGWLDEVARQIEPPKAARQPNVAARQRQIQTLRKMILAGKAKIKRARATGDTVTAQRLEKRLATTEKQLRQFEPPPQPEPEVSAASPAELEQIVRSAYLRTLSRHPNEDELNRSLQYVAETDQPVDGFRDVLWALLNTKEFLVNH